MSTGVEIAGGAPLVEFAIGHWGGVESFPSLPVTSTPVVTNITPSPSTIIFAGQLISFRVTSPTDTPFRSIIVLVQYPTLGVYEVIHDGSAFSANYTGTKSSITDGFQFSSLVRNGGWPAAPTFIVVAVDTSGQENV